MFIGLCHDLAESVVGDIPTYADVPKGGQINCHKSPSYD
jgi:5'-deoxynucleotidase YfbR-like HD superfamily hydrolase